MLLPDFGTFGLRSLSLTETPPMLNQPLIVLHRPMSRVLRFQVRPRADGGRPRQVSWSRGVHRSFRSRFTIVGLTLRVRCLPHAEREAYYYSNHFLIFSARVAVGRHVPESHLGVEAGRGQPGAVAAEGQPGDSVGAAAQV